MRTSWYILWLSYCLCGARANIDIEYGRSLLRPAGSLSAPLAPRSSGGPYAYPEHIYQAGASYNQGTANYVPFPGGCTESASNGSIADTITQCTSSQCDNHFGAICSGHASLVDKTCFCNNFDIEPYFAQCEKNAIGAAQLYRWFSTLCQDPGVQWSNAPANLTTVSNPQPTDLKAGYKDADIEGYAPSCLFTEGKSNVQGQHNLNSTWEACQFNTTGWTDIFGGSPSFQSETGNYLDIGCFCSQVGTAPMNCSSGLDPTREMLWWNATCGSTSGILPSNWTAQLIIQDSSHIKPPVWPECMQSDIKCNGTLSNVTAENLSDRCIVNADGYCASEGECLVNDGFCSAVNFGNTCVGTCKDGLDPTRALLWWDYVCGTQDLPTSWHDSLYIANNSFLNNATNNFTWPVCLQNSTVANDSLAASISQCSSDRCILDGNGLCSNHAYFTNQSCFCEPLKYQITCPDIDNTACASISERQDYLPWLNSTCSSDTDWHGLPNQWSDDLQPLIDDMIPWHWRLAPNRCSPNSTYTEKCPSNAAKLGIFAAVNAAMLAATPILGRRTIISWLTRGCLGDAHSKWWSISALLVVALQLMSNLLNAILIRRVPGYSNISIGGLTLLWCTRPRVSWLAVLLISFNAEQAMYFSAAASSLLAELVLQIFGSYYMGVVANFGTKHKFYGGMLHGAQRKKYAQMMYAGSLLWLLVIIVALGAVAWSALNVNNVIAEVGRDVVHAKLRNLAKQRTADKFTKQARKGKQKALVREENTLKRVKAMERNNHLSWEYADSARHPEYNSWKRLSGSCDVLASSWEGVEARILRIREEEQNEVNLRHQKLGHKDVLSLQKKINELDQKVKKLNKNDTNAGRIQEIQNERGDLHGRLVRYAQRRETELSTHLGFASAQQDYAERICREARPDPAAVAAGLSPELENTWTAIREDWSDLRQAWERVENSWQDEKDLLERVKNVTSNRKEGRYILKTLQNGKTKKKIRTIPIVVCLGMLLCWIAQWLFWAGFVNLASDEYCPPALVRMMGIWIGFSVTGAGVGASL